MANVTYDPTNPALTAYRGDVDDNTYAYAARDDLATLTDENDPTGLQRAALESVDGCDDIDRVIAVAQRCRDAVRLRSMVFTREQEIANGYVDASGVQRVWVGAWETLDVVDGCRLVPIGGHAAIAKGRPLA